MAERRCGAQDQIELEKHAWRKSRRVDMSSTICLRCRRRITLLRAQIMSDARVIKTQDEIALLNHSAMMVDAAYDECIER